MYIKICLTPVVYLEQIKRTDLKTKIKEVKNKIPYIPGFVKRTTFDTKIKEPK